MMPDANVFPSGGHGEYTDLSAARQEAMRRAAGMRVEMMERQARRVLEYNNDYYDTAQRERDELPTVSYTNSYRDSRPSQYDTIYQEFQPNIRKTPPNIGLLPFSGETGEQLFIALLIFLLIREKSDPCLIAALIYLLV